MRANARQAQSQGQRQAPAQIKAATSAVQHSWFWSRWAHGLVPLRRQAWAQDRLPSLATREDSASTAVNRWQHLNGLAGPMCGVGDCRSLVSQNSSGGRLCSYSSAAKPYFILLKRPCLARANKVAEEICCRLLDIGAALIIGVGTSPHAHQGVIFD